MTDNIDLIRRNLPHGAESFIPLLEESRTSEKPAPSRRNALRFGAGAVGAIMAAPALAQSAFAAPANAAATSAKAKVILLGTAGGPPAWRGRTGICSALVVDGKTYLVDVGHGAFEQIEAAGIAAETIGNIFITHLHSDHIADLYTLALCRFGGVKSLAHPGGVTVHGPGQAGHPPWFRTGDPNPMREPTITAYPTQDKATVTPGIVEYFDLMQQATAYDLNMRFRDESWPDIRTVIKPREIGLPAGTRATGDVWNGGKRNPYLAVAPPTAPWKIYEDDRVRVTATLAQHTPVFPAYAFRFDTDYGSVVFSGDTAKEPNVIRLAKNTDILVHEVIDTAWFRSVGAPEALIMHLEESHTKVEEIGGLAQEAGARTLALSHIVPGDTSIVTDASWRKRARRGYDGRLVVGRDQQVLALTGVKGRR